MTFKLVVGRLSRWTDTVAQR